ncbi:complement C1r-A subcomponent [Cyprinus carpio]|uniref:complement subcomponent C1r n=1 Tax=Cyprinus carpio TaxID=7962 RepID=A0A9Q9YZK6_CYPCA|nr:complement C1r-A subcomponent [Cyprinus carpio]
MDGIHVIICLLWACVNLCECEPAMFGEVSSPQYPQPYPANFQEQWDLEVPQGYQIQLTFNHLDIEPSPDCYYDSVSVVSDNKVLGKFCGQNSTDRFHPGDKPILAPHNRLQLVFLTDVSNHELHIGFTAFYQAVDIDECSSSSVENAPCSQICLNTLGSYLCACHHGYMLRPDQRTCVLECGGGVHSESEGTISSPGFPDVSPLNLDCIYTISVQPGYMITLNFSQNFHIEQVYNQGQTCLFHWLQVSVPGKKPEKYCGGKSPGVLNMGANFVQLEYHTDRYGQSQGWSIHYTTQRVQCPHPGIIGNGTITPNFAQYLYRDYIHVRCMPGYKLMMGEKEILSFKSICQSNGKWHLTLPECKIIDCGAPKQLLNGDFQFISGENNEYLSVIEYRCNEPYYRFKDTAKVTYRCAVERKWTEVNNNDIIPPCYPECGMNTEVSFGGRVFGGMQARPGQIPWQLLHKMHTRGGASLISDYWALTAAHVVDGLENTTMTWLGGITEARNQNPVIMEAEKIIIHPDYQRVSLRGHQTNYDNDIALIKMSARVPLGPNIRPVCLPNKTHEFVMEGTMGTVSGFGGFKEGLTSEILRYGHIREYASEKCVFGKMPVSKNMFCAGDDVEHVDSCQGDSGGPLFFPMLGHGSKEQRYEVRGIVSWGPVRCGDVSKAYYTKVENYLGWIEETMANN